MAMAVRSMVVLMIVMIVDVFITVFMLAVVVIVVVMMSKIVAVIVVMEMLVRLSSHRGVYPRAQRRAQGQAFVFRPSVKQPNQPAAEQHHADDDHQHAADEL